MKDIGFFGLIAITLLVFMCLSIDSEGLMKYSLWVVVALLAIALIRNYGKYAFRVGKGVFEAFGAIGLFCQCAFYVFYGLCLWACAFFVIFGICAPIDAFCRYRKTLQAT